MHPPEPLLEHAAQIRPVTQVRSTLIQSSLASLRERGHFARYEALIDPAERDAVLGTLAPVWLPIATGMAHYRACDGLGLDEQELRAMGQSVTERIQGTFMRSITQSAKAVGMTPWPLLEQLKRVWSRLFVEGSLALWKVGPKDCLVDMRGLSLVEFDYFCSAICGVVQGGIGVAGAKTVHVRVQERDVARASLTLRAAWV
jgi:hypothetical protein